MDKQPSEKRFALLIDADNVSAKYIKPITDELSNYGTVTIKRIYGDWTLTLHAKWKDALLENSLTPIQQFGYTQGKNATDSAMIIDAMDILYTGSVEGFCIVSSDSDFTRLASRLRESGRMVIGMGEKKTPTPFRRACDVFTTLELLLDDAKGNRKGKDAGSGPSIEEVEQAVVRIITDNQNNGKATGLGEVGSRLLKRFPDFDVRSYGTNLLSKLLSKFSRVTVTKHGSDVSVELADDKEPAKAKQERREGSDRAAQRSDAAEKPERGENAPAGDKAERGERRAAAEKAEKAEDGASDEAGSKGEKDAADKPAKRERRERDASGERAKGEAGDAEDSAGKKPARAKKGQRSGAQADAAADEERPAGERSDDRTRSGERAEDQDAAPAPDQLDDQAGDQDVSASERFEQPEGQAPSRRRKRRSAARRKGRSRSAADESAASAPAEPPAEADGAVAEPGSAPEPAGQDAPADAGAQPAGGSAAQGAQSVDEPPAAKAGRPPQGEKRSVPSEVNATTRRLVAEAGHDGIEVSELAARVRAAHRSFKVRDFGYAQFRTYVAHLGDIEVERVGNRWIARMGE